MGRKTIRDEVKVRISIALTPSTIKYVDQLAQHNNISRAETFEQIIDMIKSKQDTKSH